MPRYFIACPQKGLFTELLYVHSLEKAIEAFSEAQMYFESHAVLRTGRNEEKYSTNYVGVVSRLQYSFYQQPRRTKEPLLYLVLSEDELRQLFSTILSEDAEVPEYNMVETRQ